MTTPSTTLRVSEITSALSLALDLTAGQPSGHAARSCVFGMRLARYLQLPSEQQRDLFHALLLKDAGCSSNASMMYSILGSDDIKGKLAASRIDWTKRSWQTLRYAVAHAGTGAPAPQRIRAVFDVASRQKENSASLNQIRAERGAAIARRIGLSAASADAIFSLNEHWDGGGSPQGLRGNAIPLLSRIMHLAQTVDVFYSAHGRKAALKMVRERSGRWFDPELAQDFLDLAKMEYLWWDVDDAKVAKFEPAEHQLEATEDTIDNICLAFADVIDAKSPFTYRHSINVAETASAIAVRMGLPEEEVAVIRRAALLHDIGRLGISNSILEKQGRLSDSERARVRRHARYSYEILSNIPGFERISEVAASHHERLDGTGYFRELSADQICLSSRILAVAHMYSVLAAGRSYRDPLTSEEAFAVIAKEVPHALDADCFAALLECYITPVPVRARVAEAAAGAGTHARVLQFKVAAA